MWSLAQVEVVLGGRLLACQFDIDRGLAQPLRFVLSLTYLVWFRPLIAHNLVLIAWVASMRMFDISLILFQGLPCIRHINREVN